MAFAAERSVELAEAGVELVAQDEHATITTRPIHRLSTPAVSITPWCTNAASPAHLRREDSSTAPALHEPRDRHIQGGSKAAWRMFDSTSTIAVGAVSR